MGNKRQASVNRLRKPRNTFPLKTPMRQSLWVLFAHKPIGESLDDVRVRWLIGGLFFSIFVTGIVTWIGVRQNSIQNEIAQKQLELEEKQAEYFKEQNFKIQTQIDVQKEEARDAKTTKLLSLIYDVDSQNCTVKEQKLAQEKCPFKANQRTRIDSVKTYIKLERNRAWDDGKVKRDEIPMVDLTGLRFQKGANLTGMDFENVVLQKAIFVKAQLNSVNLQKAYLPKANLQKAFLPNANLQKANLSNVNLQKAFLSSAKLQKSKLAYANLQEADLHNANLQKAILSVAKLQKANLKETNLQKTYLIGTDLSGARLEEASFTGARYNSKTYKNILGSNFPPTKFPEGFDPKEHGMIDLNEAK